MIKNKEYLISMKTMACLFSFLFQSKHFKSMFVIVAAVSGLYLLHLHFSANVGFPTQITICLDVFTPGFIWWLSTL